MSQRRARAQSASIRSAGIRENGFDKVLQSAVDNPGETAAGPVGKDEIVKGYEYSRGQYVIIEPAELENLRVPSKHTITVSQFIEKTELNPEYVEKSYFVVPENAAQAEAFAVVREALVRSGEAAIGKVAFSGREHVFALVPASDRGMMGYTLRYQTELRDQRDYFREIKEPEISEDSLDLAENLIAKRSSPFDLSKFEDGYEVAVKELVNAKVNNLPIPKDEAPTVKRGNVVNLMDALRKSMEKDLRPRSRQAASPQPARRELAW